MPEIALDIPFASGLQYRAVAEAAITGEGKGIYFVTWCQIHQEPVAFVFHRTNRTDSRGNIVYVLVDIQSLEDLQKHSGDTLVEMKPLGQVS